jgi:cobalamin-dependent methionine synthase I
MSNVSFGIPGRKLINDVFLNLAVDAGADSGLRAIRGVVHALPDGADAQQSGLGARERRDREPASASQADTRRRPIAAPLARLIAREE